MAKKNPSELFGELRQFNQYLDRRDRIRFCVLVLLALLPALAELVVASSIALLALVFSSPGKIYSSAAGSFIINTLGLEFLLDQQNLAVFVLASLCGVVLFKNIAALYQNYYGCTFSEFIARKMILRVIRFYLYAPWHWIIRSSSADLQFSINTGFQVGQMIHALCAFITGSSTIIMLGAGVLVVSPVLSGVFLLVGGCAGLFIHQSTKRRLDSLNNKIIQQQREFSRSSYFALHGLRETKLNNLETRVFAHMREQSVLLAALLAARTTWSRLPFMMMEVFAFAALTVLLCFLFYVQHMSMEKAIAIMSFLVGVAWRILPAINKTVDAVLSIRSFYPHLRILLGVFEEEKRLNPSYAEPPADLLPGFQREITLKDLNYAYPGAENPAVEQVSFSIPKGAMVGIVGLSGAGKSTLVSLLTGLLRPGSGGIFLDDLLLTGGNHPAWMRSVGYVPQNPFFFNESLAANIAFSDWGKPINRERVTECCRLAALDFVDQLENGIDTPIGERGGRLSGGQTQRVAIARALYSRPELLIFDEATSALDQRNEIAIHNTVLSLRTEITLLIIAHRLTTVEDCDTVIWMDQGRIRAMGTPQEILPRYTAYMNSQDTWEKEQVDG